MPILIPRSAESRREMTYAKLLYRVHSDRSMVNAFEGLLLKPGSSVPDAALWPDPRYPAKPLLLEFAGSDHSGRGHNRSNQIHILWRWETEKRMWVELARTVSQAAEWIPQIVAVALRELGGPPAPDPAIAAKVSARFVQQLDAELATLGAGDRALALHYLCEHLAARLVHAETCAGATQAK